MLVFRPGISVGDSDSPRSKRCDARQSISLTREVSGRVTTNVAIALRAKTGDVSQG